jgi:hypothetical protein
MAKQKMSKAERQELEADLATLRRAVAQCEKELAEDDEASKAAEAESTTAAIKAIADGGTGDKHAAIARGVLAIRERGGNRIADAVHRKKNATPMNQGNIFVPSDQLRLRSANASKVAAQSVEDGEGAFSAAEIELARKLVEESSEDARLFVNGELVRVGLRWLPGGRERWNG